jgi:hypothetical protein
VRERCAARRDAPPDHRARFGDDVDDEPFVRVASEALGRAGDALFDDDGAVALDLLPFELVTLRVEI